MNFTQEQISELMLNIANSENGTNLLMQMTLETFMKSEPVLHQLENPTDYANRFESKYSSIKSFKNERNIAYFAYLDYPPQIQRMVCSTNRIERLNRDYKRVLKMRGAKLPLLTKYRTTIIDFQLVSYFSTPYGARNINF